MSQLKRHPSLQLKMQTNLKILLRKIRKMTRRRKMRVISKIRTQRMLTRTHLSPLKTPWLNLMISIYSSPNRTSPSTLNAAAVSATALMNSPRKRFAASWFP
jgi:hypothetical protein